MLMVVELARWCESLGLSAEARAVIETIRSSPPARRVRSAAGNVSVRYPSRKMGVTIQAERHRVELAGLYEYEHDH
jgi:putative transposase